MIGTGKTRWARRAAIVSSRISYHVISLSMHTISSPLSRFSARTEMQGGQKMDAGMGRNACEYNDLKKPVLIYRTNDRKHCCAAAALSETLE